MSRPPSFIETCSFIQFSPWSFKRFLLFSWWCWCRSSSCVHHTKASVYQAVLPWKERVWQYCLEYLHNVPVGASANHPPVSPKHLHFCLFFSMSSTFIDILLLPRKERAFSSSSQPAAPLRWDTGVGASVDHYFTWSWPISGAVRTGNWNRGQGKLPRGRGGPWMADKPLTS